MYTRRKLLAGLGAASLGALAVRAIPFDSAAKARDGQRIPNLELKTHTGTTVRFYDDLIRGKVVAINMMYARCTGICLGMTANLRRVQGLLGERVGRDVFMYSITLQPELDTPQRLKEYVEMHGVKPGWLFLTGALADIEDLRYSLGFYDPDPVVDADKSSHTGMVRIGNEMYDRWTMSPALAEPMQIVATINHVDKSVVHTAGIQAGS